MALALMILAATRVHAHAAPAAPEPPDSDGIEPGTDAPGEIQADGETADDSLAVDELSLDPFGLVGTAVGDPSELRDIAAHHHRLSSIGRVDVSIVWRRRWRPREPADAAVRAVERAMPNVEPVGLAHTDTVLVLATWRK